MPTVRLTITGKVQGVFYRASAQQIAAQRGVTGWIKSTADDHVEALVSGTQMQLDEFIRWCWQGPSKARVDNIILTIQPEQKFDRFIISS